MPFVDSLEKNAVKGNAYVGILGGMVLNGHIKQEKRLLLLPVLILPDDFIEIALIRQERTHIFILRPMLSGQITMWNFRSMAI